MRLVITLATFGNHEFDWGTPGTCFAGRQYAYPGTLPYVTANIVKNNWRFLRLLRSPGSEKPIFRKLPLINSDHVGVAGGALQVGFIGVTTTETPTSPLLQPRLAYASRIRLIPLFTTTIR